ncbi:lytic transglycosylase domain-containing protein (plasmid) [Lichenicola cladoniae]|uniref:Lytic transglycosylase domain-containing protein n=1 Tax=Lichenicola cladoniae TaxID=1484109 RepID=A0A6M8HZI4_9PROT|nr:lytic transglycosylase domain-containing protein [Lichenicola cladoniae]NPD70358.1 lytic transglycosylase domain-containing protein [Acetobacteraceae bacterium]QKE93984.1 lytic transglycosylase domain-containing protein [Lichenicola cladoniae]
MEEPAFPTYRPARPRPLPLPQIWTTSLLALATTILVPLTAGAATLSLSTFTEDAKGCAQHVAVETLAAVAHTESGFDVLTLHDNSTGRTYHPATREDAIALGVELVTVSRHSVDLGLMQINSGNLPRLGLSVADTFDPCLNLSAADRVLVDGYAAPASGRDTQPAVQQALSRYNTGDPVRGVANGYVGRVQASAELVVPALRVKGDAPPAQPATPADDVAVLAQPLPPSWDVYARAKAGHGQVFGASPVPSPAAVPAALSAALPAPSAPAGPAPGQRLSIEAQNDVR